ncbi:MAG: 4Fe-4S dicluster domain-containing protein [Candidatus Sumerlaeia bacterium]|nr:4Fe-4S dicluster domain-containing protein [Candidatus Sumerlaeia bacterium]
MRLDRRDFLKCSAAGVAGLAAVRAVLPASVSPAAEGRSAAGSSQKPKRWAMVVDLQKCFEGKAKACVSACHQWHNVPEWPEERLEVKWIWEEKFSRLFPDQSFEHMPATLRERPVLALCNHCANPPCVRVCPTKATFKRPDGIVAMDMHRCIGCRFCIAACPYGARSFNWKNPREAENLKHQINLEYPTRARGVVEKCNFCAERLAAGLQPICVERAEDAALIFGDLNDPASKVTHVLAAGFAIRRKPSLETDPQVYYLISAMR